MLTAEQLLRTLDSPFTFTRRPVAVPADVRASWKVLLVLEMLDKCCRGNRSSLRRLHLLNWATRSPDHAEVLLGALSGSVDPATVLVRLDPSLDRAIARARGYGYVIASRGNRVTLTRAGQGLLKGVDTSGVLEVERAILKQIGHQLSEGKTDDILEWFSR